MERRDGVGNATGLNALPAGVNATLLAHDGAASIQCEWVQAQRGGDVSNCSAAVFFGSNRVAIVQSERL